MPTVKHRHHRACLHQMTCNVSTSHTLNHNPPCTSWTISSIHSQRNINSVVSAAFRYIVKMPGQFVQPKYPSMERQDFTQGQLGSFKFTPVDVPSSNTLGDTPMLLAAQAMLRDRVRKQTQLVTADNQTEFSQSVIASQQWANQPSTSQSASASALAFEPTPPPSALSKPDSEFFNTHIKPDLEESRLKLGPAAFRAAVDGNSPDSSLSQIRSRAEVSHPQQQHVLATATFSATLVVIFPASRNFY